MDITFAHTKMNQRKTYSHFFFFKAANNQEDSYLHVSSLCQHFSIQLFGKKIKINQFVLCYGPTYFYHFVKNSQTFSKICPISQSEY